MEEEDCNRMLDHLQQYVPHLEKLIAQLKDPKRKNRELQLSKLEGLHSMITDRRKKLKLDTLKKCEDVILKILQKVNPNIPNQLQQKAASADPRVANSNLVKFVCKDPPEDATIKIGEQGSDDINSIRLKVARARLSEIFTPASPSPTRDLARNHSPILIPVDKINMQDSYEKPDIYRRAAESLTLPNTPGLVDRLSPGIDMSKPPLSEEDLLLLTEPEREVYLEETSNLSMVELENLRTAIQLKLVDTEDKKSDDVKKLECIKENKSDNIKIIKDPSNKFKDKDMKTHTDISNNLKEPEIQKLAPQPVPPPVKFLKGSPKIETVLKDPNSKFGDLLSSIDLKLLGDVCKKKDKKIGEDPKRKSTEKKHDKSKSGTDEKDKKPLITEKKEKFGGGTKLEVSIRLPEKLELNNQTSSPPVYKRLADKYNPKPRKTSTDVIEKSQSQELRTTIEIRSPETSFGPKWFDRDPNFELPCDKASLMLGLPSVQSKPLPSVLGNHYVPNPNTMLQNKSSSCQVPNQNQFTSPPHSHFTPQQQNQYASPIQNYTPPQHNQYASPQQNQYPTPQQNQFTSPNQNQYSQQNQFAVPHLNQFNPPQNMILPSLNMGPQNVMVPPQNILTQHNSGGNTYMNTYIVQNNVSSNVAHGHFNNTLNTAQNTFHNQNKSFNPFHPIENESSHSSDYFQQQNKQALLPTPTYPGYPQNNYGQYSNRPPADPRKGAISRDPRDRSFDNNYRQDNRPKETTSNNLRGSVNCRDPRVRNNKPISKETSRRPPPDVPITKYDSLYSNMDKDSDAFVSPLNSLYSAGETAQKTGKGYGFQKFRIPKRNDKPQCKPKAIEKDRLENDRPKQKSNEDNYPHDDTSTQDESDEEVISKEQVRCRVIKSESPSPPPVITTSKTDDSNSKIVAASQAEKPIDHAEESHCKDAVNTEVKEIISKIEKCPDIALPNESKDENTEMPPLDTDTTPIETSSNAVMLPASSEAKTDTPDVISACADTVSDDTKDKQSIVSEGKSDTPKATPTEEDIIATYLAGLFQKANKEELLSAILTSLACGTVGNNKKLKQIQKIFESDSGGDDENESEPKAKIDVDTSTIPTIEPEEKLKEPKEEISKEISEEVVVEEPSQPAPIKLKKKVRGRRFLTLRKKKHLNFKGKSSTTNSTSSLDQLENPEQVIESVGERIKNRKRNLNTGKSRKGRKCRTELDMLHEDIKEMFIRDGILTATGKRMCRMLKSDEPVAIKNTRSKSIEESSSTSSVDLPKRQAQSSNPKVIIEKTDLTKLAIPMAIKLSADKSDSESDMSIKKHKRNLRQKRRYINSTSTSESSLSSPLRKFPKRKIKNKPNYYEDPNDLSIPKQPAREKTPILDVQSPISQKVVEPNNITPDLEKVLPVEAPETPPVTKIKSPTLKVKKSPLHKKINKTKLKLTKKITRKKKPGWSLGIIKKKKRSSISNTPTTSVQGDQEPGHISDVEESVCVSTPPPSTPEPAIVETTKEKDSDLIEPDANYYFDPQEKPTCKICSFKGKFIVQHYKSLHPNDEVLISRISPGAIKMAIEESVDNGYEDIEIPLQDDSKYRKKKFTYKCRFCHTFFKNETTETFFDHLTSHTGEYRFSCTLCSFKTSNSKALRSHYHSSHTATFEQIGIIVPVYETPSSYHIVFGYACSECYFIQLDQAAITQHMKIYHLGENNKIYKINMSMIVMKQTIEPLETEQITDEGGENLISVAEDVSTAAPPQETINTTEDANNVLAPTSPKAAEIENMEKIDKPAEVIETVQPAQVVDKNENNTVNDKFIKHNKTKRKKKKLTVKSKPNKIPNEAKKNNVFEALEKDLLGITTDTTGIITETTAISKESTEVLESVKVTEPTQIVNPIENLGAFQDTGEFVEDLQVNDSLMETSLELPARKSFNLLDKIRSRLEGSKNEEINLNELQDISTLNVEASGAKPEVKKLEEGGKVISALDNLDTPTSPQTYSEFKVPKSPLPKRPINNHSPKPQNELKFPDKNLGSINDITERLQGKLNVDITQKTVDDKLIIPKIEEVVFHVGPITATKRNDYILYSCNLNSCSFSTTISTEYSIHCTSFHNGHNWNRFCNICDAMLEHCGFEIIDAYNHLLSVHLVDDIELIKEQATDQVANNKSIEQTEESLIVRNAEWDSPFKILSVETEEEQPTQIPEAHDFPFLLSDFRTLSSDVDETGTSQVAISTPKTNTVIPNLTLISSITISGTSTLTQSCSAIKSPLLTTTSSLPPSLMPISKTPLPALVPVNKTSPVASKCQELTSPNMVTSPQRPSKRILLRDTPLVNEELIKERKNKSVLPTLLTETKLAHLYKCPEYDCTFSTDFKRSFDSHINQHTEIPREVQIPCLYCNYKTEFGNIAIHYDVRHSKCTYCCVYCFYRAINQSYVEMHQEQNHPNMPRRVLIVPLNQDALLSQANITLLPIRDVVPPFICGCLKKFVLISDLLTHAKTEHSGKFTCGYCMASLQLLDSSIMIHMQAHNVAQFHCRYCLFGANNTDFIYKHLSLQHFAHAPKIVTRRFIVNTNNAKQSWQYEYDDDELFNCLKIITRDYYKYFTPSARREISTSPTSGSLIQSINKVYKPTIGSTALPKNTSESQSANNSVQQRSRPNSPTIINQLLNFDSSLLDIIPPTISDITSNADALITLNNSTIMNGALKINDADMSTAEHENIVTTSTDLNRTKLTSKPQENDTEISVPDATQPCILDNTDNNLNITPSEANVSMADSTSDLMDLPLSDSGETHLSDLAPEATSVTTSDKKKTGLSGGELFKCVFCNVSLQNTKAFRSHIVKCVATNNCTDLRPYKCAHCVKTFKAVNNLIDHLRVHGENRFSCSLCDYKGQHQLYVRQHMKTKHKVTNITVKPIHKEKRDYDKDEFVVRPKLQQPKSGESSDKDSVEGDEKLFKKSLYSPEEVDRLPFRPIFFQAVGCSICGYLTKVKANLLRHFHLHLKNASLPVPTSAPINPVPCLETNEKMFDKMTNLSLSGYNLNSSRMSLKEEKKEEPLVELTPEELKLIPVYVPSTKRNVCGATGCDYLCLDVAMFRCHLAALHAEETFYKCKHCDAILSPRNGPINVAMIIKHQKLHDLNLYKCKYCSYCYCVRHKVEYHIETEHPDQVMDIVVIREMDSEPIDPTLVEREREEIKEPKPWRCGMCKYRCGSNSEVVTHILNKHDMDDGQYKCALCTYKNNSMSVFQSHFEGEHSGLDVDVINVYYKVEDVEDEFDTTPIWNLNRNSKCIRGIPLELTKTKKTPTKSTVIDNLDRSIDSVASGTATPNKTKLFKEKESENITSKDVKPSKAKERRKSISIAKKLKALKDKSSDAPVEIIEIEDDSTDVVTKEISLSDNETTTLKEIEDMDLAQLIQANLSGKFGPFGTPLSCKYLCPLCKTFKTSKTQDITYHLYKDLKYYRFICTLCRLYGITYKFLFNHSQNKHPLRPESIIPISPDNDIEDWVKKVITVQTRIIESNRGNSVKPISTSTLTVSPAIPDATSSTITDGEKSNKAKGPFHQCPHCDYTCKNHSDIRKHEKRHWLQKPLKCGYCDVEGISNYEISMHSKRAHPNRQPSIISVPTPSSPTIQPISRKRKRHSVAQISDTSDVSVVSDSRHQSGDDSRLEIEDRPVYVCNYCRKRCYNENDIDNHLKEVHPGKDTEFKYKKVLSSQLPKKQSINYKCFYCDFINHLDEMKTHFKMEHPTLNLSLFRYQCPYCNDYFRKLEKVKAHCKQMHSDDNPENLDIKVVGEPKITKEFPCDFCNLQFALKQELLDHCKLIHSDIENNTIIDNKNANSTSVNALKPAEMLEEDKKDYMCPECYHTSNSFPSIVEHLRHHAKSLQCFYCDARFTYPSIVKIHISKEHPGIETKYFTVEEAVKKVESLKKKLLVLQDGLYIPISSKSKKRVKVSSQQTPTKKQKTEPRTKPTARKSTTQLPVIKETARKSTTQMIPTIELDDDDEEDEGFSYYGTPPDLEGLENIKMSLNLEDKMVTMNVKQFSSFLDIYPTVPVINFAKSDSHL